MTDERIDALEERPYAQVTLTTGLAVTLHCIAWAALLLLLQTIVARFNDLFADFGVDLPGFTILYLQVADLLFASPLILLLLCAGAVVSDALAYRALLRSGSRTARLWWFWTILVLPLGIGLLGAAALLMVNIPLFELS